MSPPSEQSRKAMVETTGKLTSIRENWYVTI